MIGVLFAACHSEVEKIVSLAASHNVVVMPFGGKFCVLCQLSK